MDQDPQDDHQCVYRERLEEVEKTLADQTETISSQSQQIANQNERLDNLTAQLEALQNLVFGRRSEKVTPIARELRSKSKADPEKTKTKRKRRKQARKDVPKRFISHSVPEARRTCSTCGLAMRANGRKKTEILELVPAFLELQIHERETLRCECGAFECAPPPQRVFDKCQYGPKLVASAVVAKCSDSLPLSRQEKILERGGALIPRSTLSDLFHKAGQKLAPLCDKLEEVVAKQEIIHADETPAKSLELPKGVLSKDRKGNVSKQGYFWVFLAAEINLLSFKYVLSRSGEVPRKVLGHSLGALVVDAYSGYNTQSRKRVGCWAHVRRYFFKAKSHFQVECDHALSLIRELYQIEHEVRKDGLLGSPEHADRRKKHSQAILNQLKSWLAEQKGQCLPRGKLHEALTYLENQWSTLTEFVKDVRLPLDNNISERALRIIALGRHNWNFVGNESSGQNLARLYSLVKSAEANGLNPEQYLADVLMKVEGREDEELERLLPHKWKPPRQNSGESR